MLKWFIIATLVALSKAQDLDDSTSIDVAFSEEDANLLSKGASQYEFQAEVTRLMEIIVNSLYKTRDIFLRELISNANDAIDKIRYQSLTNKEVLQDKTDLEIRIQADKESGTLTILDSGVGMTDEELAKNLGTIAHSGTASFLDAYSAATEKGDNPLSLIGQFGVGFYSAFLVADEVTVISKSPKSDKQYVWRSTAQGNFTVSEDPRGVTLGRGTAVILKVKEDALNFLDNEEIENTVKRYSEFMQYPIYLYSSRLEEVEEEVDEDEEETEGEEDELSVEEEETQGEKKRKKVQRTTYFWKRLNSQKPIWSRRPNSVSEEEYDEFYKMFAHETDAPLAHSHFKAEGEIEFDSLLYLPSKAPKGFYDQYYQSKSTLRLYVRKVLVADQFEDIIPRYLNFIKGLVDSNDLPLNVNREDLQKSKVMTLISRKLTRKALDMLRDLARREEEEEEEEEEEDTDEEAGDEETEETMVDKEAYSKFWEQYGKSIKLGILEDTRNRKRLLDLLRFPSAQSPKKQISLASYVENMREGQKYIYYLASSSEDEAENSPFMERFRSKGFDVLYFIDNLDEYLNLQEYDDIPLQSISKEDVELDGKKMKDYLKSKEEEFEPLFDYLKNLYGSKISKVQISNTLTTSAMAISTGKYGYSANMERISKAQAFGGNYPMRATKILQLNYRHPIIIELKNRVDDGDTDDDSLNDYANLLLDSALIKSGFDIETDDQVEFDNRIQRLLRNSLSIPLDATLEPEPDFANEIETEEEEDDEGDDEDEEDEEDEDKEEL